MSQHQHERSTEVASEAAGQGGSAPSVGVGPGAVSIFAIREAIAHGLVVSVDDMARAVGFDRSVAVTQRVWSEVIMNLAEPGRPYGDGLWGLLSLAWTAIRLDARPEENHEVRFSVKVYGGQGTALRARTVKLDDGSRHTTLLLRDED